ncbi:MAG: hypothetical protein HXY24_10230 [Rubrivivax sp.]|nr:hypothetical protein [Rubrivivax sp.]
MGVADVVQTDEAIERVACAAEARVVADRFAASAVTDIRHGPAGGLARDRRRTSNVRRRVQARRLRIPM